MSQFQTIKLDVSEGIATITLHRPDRMNAWTVEMCSELQQAFDFTDENDDVRAVIVTGEGRAYCAGADLGAGADTFNYAKDSTEGPVAADGTINWGHVDVRDSAGLIALRIYRSLKPVIAAINGPAVGAGITTTLPMDVRLAVPGAKMGFVFARRGIVSEGASSWFLPRIVGVSKAIEWCTSGRVFLAEEALEAGLVRSLHAPEDLLPAARALAHEMTDHSAPVSVAMIRQMIWHGIGDTHPMSSHQIESRLVYSRGRSNDVGEGVKSFLEKRAPVFPDRVSKDMPEFFPWWDEPEWQ